MDFWFRCQIFSSTKHIKMFEIIGIGILLNASVSHPITARKFRAQIYNTYIHPHLDLPLPFTRTKHKILNKCKNMALRKVNK